MEELGVVRQLLLLTNSAIMVIVGFEEGIIPPAIVARGEKEIVCR